VKQLGQRFNVLMTIQVPLKQKPKPRKLREEGGKWKSSAKGAVPPSFFDGFFGAACAAPESAMMEEDCLDCESAMMEYSPCSGGMDCSDDDFEDPFGAEFKSLNCSYIADHDHKIGLPPQSECLKSSVVRRRSSSASLKPAKKKGRANAARVSRGSEADTWAGLSVKEPKRNPAEHITVTCVLYNTVAGGVPSEEDVAAAIDDMEKLYEGCQWNGRLASEGADFMKAELTVADALGIQSKVVTQPYKPEAAPVAGFDAFPIDEPSAPAQHKNVICDVSGMHPIVGARFKKKGEDYDLCRAEFFKLRPEDQAMYEVIETPGAAPVDATMWIVAASAE